MPEYYHKTKVYYCELCDRKVMPVKYFNWPIFLLLCITGIGGIFYLVYYIFKSKDRCPICRGYVRRLYGRPIQQSK